ncbi:MAG: hemin uptake protein HemP [Pseudomonadota bacterium]
MNAMTKTFPPKVTLEQKEITTYDARDLIENGVQARIVLDENVYVLRITKAGKLILTK